MGVAPVKLEPEEGFFGDARFRGLYVEGVCSLYRGHYNPGILGPSLRWDDGCLCKNSRHPSEGWDPGTQMQW
jgi:hypothetical protein